MTINMSTPRDWDNAAKASSKSTVIENDMVNSPKHYTSGGIECIEAIKASMSIEGYRGYCKGNAIKYLWRYEHKGNSLEDLRKAQWYLNENITTYNKHD